MSHRSAPPDATDCTRRGARERHPSNRDAKPADDWTEDDDREAEYRADRLAEIHEARRDEDGYLP